MTLSFTTIGAAVSGLDLREPLDDETFEELDRLPTEELHRRAVRVAERRLDIRFFWKLFKMIGGHVSAGPSFEVDSVFARAIERHREHVAVAPRRAHLDFVAALGEFRAHAFVDATLQPEQSRRRFVRIERRREMHAGIARGFDRLLQVHLEFHQVEEELQRPLILLVTALGPECNPASVARDR